MSQSLSRLLSCLAAVVVLAGVSGVLGRGVSAGEADVLSVKLSKMGGGVYRFDVTVAHADTGWEHYADNWQVLDLDGNLLGERILAHPHEREQPFTRSTTVAIPAGLVRVRVRAHDKVHDFGGTDVVVEIAR